MAIVICRQTQSPEEGCYIYPKSSMQWPHEILLKKRRKKYEFFPNSYVSKKQLCP